MLRQRRPLQERGGGVAEVNRAQHAAAAVAVAVANDACDYALVAFFLFFYFFALVELLKLAAIWWPLTGASGHLD